MTSQLILMANSPGELSALAKPLAEKFSLLAPDLEIVLVLTPCQFASGREIDVAKSFRGVSQVVPPGESMRWILWGRKPKGWKRREKGILLFLGGDPFYPLLLSSRLRYPRLAYFDHYNRWAKYYRKCFLPNDFVRSLFSHNGTGPDPLHVVGDLMVDSIGKFRSPMDIRKEMGLLPHDPVITFLPGSREFQIQHLIPLYLKAAARIRSQMPSAQFVCSLSPYTRMEDFKRAIMPIRPKSLGIEGYGTIVAQGDKRILRTNKVALHLSQGYLETFAASDICVTSPGTNTAQIAILGVPMIVVFPLQYPDAIPLEGLAHFITQWPWVGRQIRQRIIRQVLSTQKFFALPNIRTNQSIVPEIVGDVTPDALAQSLLELLRDPGRRKSMQSELQKSMGGAGASGRMAEETLGILRESSTV